MTVNQLPTVSVETARLLALQNHLMDGDYPEAKDIGEIEVRDGTGHFEAFGNEYLVLTDDEADRHAGDYIRDSIWAFNASFLSGYTGLPEEVFKALQDKYEDATDTFIELVECCGGGIEGFVDDAITSDGRGHFMSSYDGEEHAQGQFYIYRTD